MSYTGTGANPMERSSGSQVGQRMYPLESVASVTTATTALLTTLQSSGWEPRAGYGVPMDESTEQPALHTEVSGVNTLSATERERGAFKSHRAQTEGVPYYRREYTHPITTQIEQVGSDEGTNAVSDELILHKRHSNPASHGERTDTTSGSGSTSQDPDGP